MTDKAGANKTNAAEKAAEVERAATVSTNSAESEATPAEDLSFKQAQDELESIVRALESGMLELEESLCLYERGVTLLKSLRGRLQTAEQKVAVLMGELEPETE